MPSEDTKAYLFAKLVTEPVHEFYVYFEAPGPAGPATIDRDLFGTVKHTAGLREIVIHARNGSTRLAVPPETS